MQLRPIFVTVSGYRKQSKGTSAKLGLGVWLGVAVESDKGLGEGEARGGPVLQRAVAQGPIASPCILSYMGKAMPP